MASRMEKFHNRRPLTGKRSQKNQLLYKHIENLLEINNEEFISKHSTENEKSITKLENIFDNYEHYKHAKKERTRSYDSYKENMDIYNSLNEFEYDLSHLSRMSRFKEKEKFELSDNYNLTDITSHLNNKSLKTPDIKKEESISTNNLESLFSQKNEFSKNKKQNKTTNKIYINDEEYKKRKSNLKVKKIVGIIFIINTIIILFLIFRSIL